MQRDFLKELDNIVKKTDTQAIPEVIVKQLRFNVFKRSLPVSLNRCVLFGVTLDEANWWIENKLQTKSNDDGLIYYDVIAVDASKEEHDVYYNPKVIVKEI